MSTKHTTLSWPDRMALIEQYQPDDQSICTAFGVSSDELSSARGLQGTGMFCTSTTFDAVRYGNPFQASNNTSPSLVASGASQKTKPSTVHGGVPETATKRNREPQKRGRKGDKISVALQSVPFTAVPVTEFCQQHDVSLAVLRQSKRFISKLDPEVAQSIGTIHVRQNKDDRTLMIWREVSTTAV